MCKKSVIFRVYYQFEHNMVDQLICNRPEMKHQNKTSTFLPVMISPSHQNQSDPCASLLQVNQTQQVFPEGLEVIVVGTDVLIKRLCRTEVKTKAAMLNAAANALNAIHLMCPVTRVQSSECRCLTRAGPASWRSSVTLSDLCTGLLFVREPSLLAFDALNGLWTDFISDLLLHSEPSSYARLFSYNPLCFIQNIMLCLVAEGCYTNFETVRVQ